MLNLSRSKFLMLCLGGVVVLAFLAIALLRPGADVAGQQPDGPTDAYEFPIKGGTKEWAELEMHSEMLEACQVPESILREMSTEGLIETCLNYPLYWEVVAYNSPQQGFDVVASRFSGLQELLRREDAGSKLLARYCKMDPEAIGEDWTLLQKGKYAVGFTYIEMLLAQDDIISRLTPAERRDLLAECLQKSHSKQVYAEGYGYTGQANIAWIMGRILQKEDAEGFNQKIRGNENLQIFLEGGSFMDEEILNDIFLQAQRYLAK